MLPVSLDCLSSPYVLCTKCCQFLWIGCLHLMSCVLNVANFSGLFVFVLCLVYPMLPVSLDCLHLISCVPNVASFSGLFVFALCLVYPMLPVFLDCLHLMSCVPNVASFSRLSSPYVLCTQCCQFLWIVFTLCLVYPMLPVSLDCQFLFVPSVFSNVSWSCLYL